MFGQRQLASWILVMSISVLVVTTGDPDCYKSENGFVVNLNIGGCSFQVSFVVFENSGGFSYNNKDFTKATAQSDKITFNNEKNASFYSPVAKSVRDWVWILCSVLGVAIVIVCVVISSILYCIFHKKDEKPQVVESYVAGSKQPLPAIVVTPSVKKESAKSKTSPGWAYAKNAEIARSTRQREIERRKKFAGASDLARHPSQCSQEELGYCHGKDEGREVQT
ncbi:hypothetical protein M3Y94_00407400 [Aphelenchoides besseyi]|nr:hypothetical protein M3Y94_00407400 [Aphelenchoides besseyi]